jgi:GNAT superfamily N-acetyltransferase
MDTELIIGGADLLPRIEPLWCGLRDIHTSTSSHFSDIVRDMDFESRRLGLLGKSVGGHILVQILSLPQTMGEKDIAYCVSTINLNGIAEIDSIYVKDGYRNKGLGGMLMKGALEWIDEHDVREVRTSVVWGNGGVLPFYQRHGLYPRSIVLLRRQ